MHTKIAGEDFREDTREGRGTSTPTHQAHWRALHRLAKCGAAAQRARLRAVRRGLQRRRGARRGGGGGGGGRLSNNARVAGGGRGALGRHGGAAPAQPERLAAAATIHVIRARCWRRTLARDLHYSPNARVRGEKTHILLSDRPDLRFRMYTEPTSPPGVILFVS